MLRRRLGATESGRLPESANYGYGRDGRIESVRVDEGVDGTDDVVHTYRYDERGNPSSWEIRRLSGQAAGREDRRVQYVYDAKGALIEERVDARMDGIVDVRCTYDPPCPGPIPNRSCKPACARVTPDATGAPSP